jgi:hypothetical protein
MENYEKIIHKWKISCGNKAITGLSQTFAEVKRCTAPGSMAWSVASVPIHLGYVLYFIYILY